MIFLICDEKKSIINHSRYFIIIKEKIMRKEKQERFCLLDVLYILLQGHTN